MWEKLQELKQWLLSLDYGELAAPKEKNIVVGVVDLSRYESNLIISLIPENTEDSNEYDFEDGQSQQLEITMTLLVRGDNQTTLISKMSKYVELLEDSIHQDCTLNGIGEGSALGTRKYYLDAGAVENQLVATEITLTILYIKKF